MSMTNSVGTARCVQRRKHSEMRTIRGISFRPLYGRGTSANQSVSTAQTHNPKEINKSS